MADWTDLCVRLVAPFEGCQRIHNGLVYPYLDKLARPPVATRGYGRTYNIRMDSAPISKAQARDELRAGLQTYAAQVVTLAPALASRPECLAAVTSWAWNCGTGLFKRSRLRRAINAGQWDQAAEFIRKPDTAGGVVYRGLVRRREAERALFLLGAG